ncbi:MAG: hypothetical protein ABUT39_15875 [Acidobacteriota bacterium]
MKIDHYFPVKKLSPFMVLIGGGSMFLVKGRLPQDSLDGEVDVSSLAVQCEIKFSELINLSVNKNNQDVTVLYGPRRFEHDTAAFTLESAEAREAFLDIVARRLPGGFAREEERYGPFRNIFGPAAGVLLSATAAVSLGIDLARGFDWQVAVMLAVSSFFLLGTLGWLVERLKAPAVMIHVEPKAGADN